MAKWALWMSNGGWVISIFTGLLGLQSTSPTPRPVPLVLGLAGPVSLPGPSGPYIIDYGVKGHLGPLRCLRPLGYGLRGLFPSRLQPWPLVVTFIKGFPLRSGKHQLQLNWTHYAGTKDVAALAATELSFSQKALQLRPWWVL
ncbi:hypothetical protein O181_074416 [Austropuccinia psidii MF-1]|uniref:Uncharacterized protein n=1 Tax=Austropuccinia psidii MF-1 TaxID=1389203 RepID=A0A9Q3I974_9BASI|nr:hypothetical protein [Austropuccinia psidii MF-1]